jgi:hypothetical protein
VSRPRVNSVRLFIGGMRALHCGMGLGRVGWGMVRTSEFV